MLPTLETERIILRPFKQTDLMDMFEYCRDPRVGPAAGWRTHGSLEETRGILASFMEKDEVMAIVYKPTGRVIGSLGLHMDEKRAAKDVRMLGYVLSGAYWGMGLMPEAARAALRYAFGELQVRLVSVYHFPDNARSRRVIEKLGFRCEGTLRHASVLPSGEIADDVCYSMTKEEFEALDGGAAARA